MLCFVIWNEIQGFLSYDGKFSNILNARFFGNKDEVTSYCQEMNEKNEAVYSVRKYCLIGE